MVVCLVRLSCEACSCSVCVLCCVLLLVDVFPLLFGCLSFVVLWLVLFMVVVWCVVLVV